MSSDKSSETYCWFDELFITNSPVINHTPIKRSTGSFDIIWINYVNVYTKSSQLRSCLSPSKNLTLCRAEQDVACTQSPQECAVIAWPLCLRSAPQRACSRVATNRLLIHHLMCEYEYELLSVDVPCMSVHTAHLCSLSSKGQFKVHKECL